MHYSSKIKKFYEGMQVYEHLFVYDNTLLMTEYLKKIRKGLEHADDMLFVDYVCRHIKEHNWEDIENNYLKWKKYTEPAWDQLMEKQEQELRKYLEKDIMRFAPVPSPDSETIG